MDRRQFVNTSLLAALVNIVKGMTKEKHTKMTKPNKGKIVVIGAGAFGGWTAFHLLDRGCDGVLLDAFGPGNSRASSGGDSRVIRGIYGPDKIYVDLVSRSFRFWKTYQKNGINHSISPQVHYGFFKEMIHTQKNRYPL